MLLYGLWYLSGIRIIRFFYVFGDDAFVFERVGVGDDSACELLFAFWGLIGFFVG